MSTFFKDESESNMVLPRVTSIHPVQNWWIYKSNNMFDRAIALVIFDYFELEMEVIEQSTALIGVSDLGLPSMVEILNEKRDYIYSETYPGN
jgi:hypothetical protein